MNALKLPFQFDTALIKEEIAQFSQEDYYDIYNPSVSLKTLWSKHLIEPFGGPDREPEFLPNEALRKCPYLLSILDSFKCKKETYRIHSLHAGEHIKAHRDIGYSLEHGKIRLHIPIQTDNKVEIIINEERIQMRAGECWYCNFHLTHEVNNHSPNPRIHLIMDCMVNGWVEELFQTALAK